MISAITMMENIPSAEEILSVDRESPLDWNPLRQFQQFENQSEESFFEQKSALQHIIKTINKFRTITGRESTNYTKNQIIYGAPGTGKSFICQMLVLFCLTLGLNIISTLLLGVQAVSLGGKHIHKLFCLPNDDRIQ